MEKKFFFYARVSKEWEYDDSLNQQIEILRWVALRNKHTVEDIDIIKETESWNKWDRKKFDEMLKKLFNDSKKPLNKREYGWIYIFKLDRLSRNYNDFSKVEKLLDLGYKIISATETIENTPTWRLLFRMLWSIAIYESEKLSNRQIYTRITNSIHKNFKELWFKLIFWYEYKDKKIQICEKQQEVILKVYHIYLELIKKPKISKSEKYKIIWQRLDNNDKLIIKHFLLKIKRQHDSIKSLDKKIFEEITDKEENFIKNIILNEHEIKYNWNLTIKVSVKDDLIVNYIKNLKEKEKDNNYDLEWDNEIWWFIKLRFFFNNLCVVDNNTYKNVHEDKRKYNNKKIDENWEINIENNINKIWKYSDLLFFINSDWKKEYLSFYEKMDLENNNIYNNYRVTFSTDQWDTKKIKTDISVSEWIIDKEIEKRKLFKNLKFTQDDIKIIGKELELTIKKYKQNSDKSINSSLIAKKGILISLENDLANISLLDDKDRYEEIFKNKKIYKEDIEELENKIKKTDEKFDSLLSWFLNIFNKKWKDFIVGDDKDVNETLKILIEWIEIKENEKKKGKKWNRIVKVYFHKYIEEILWLKNL